MTKVDKPVVGLHENIATLSDQDSKRVGVGISSVLGKITLTLKVKKIQFHRFSPEKP